MIRFLNDSIAEKYRGKTCLLRIDLNIESWASLDSYRLQAIIPTIKLLLKHKVNIVILSHRGRPSFAKATKDKPKGSDKRLSLRPFVPIIGRKISHHVDFCRLGRVVLLENLRFFPGEEKNDAKFARQLASLGDFYVNDAFAVSHRNNASVCAITKYLPSYGGLCLEKELKNLGAIVDYSTHPFVVVLGGAKLKEKILKLKKLIGKADSVLLGSSAFNESGVSKEAKFAWPDDAKSVNRRGKRIIWDIGPFTVNYYAELINKAGMVVWNGPPGFFEKKEFNKGTIGIWKAVLKSASRRKKIRVVVGGGETIASLDLVKKTHIPKNIFLSTGGGAMLDYLSGKKLPGIEALR